MARNEPARASGRRARKQQQRQQQKQQQNLWPPVAMCVALAIILALSIAFGRPAATAATATASVMPSASVSPVTSHPTAEPTPTVSPESTPEPTPAPRPSYVPAADDPFDQAYQRYHDEILAKKYTGQTMADLDVFGQEDLTPRWFGLAPKDLPMLRDKLLAGAPTAYTMSLISLVMGYDPPAHPQEEDLTTCQAWLQDFEARRAAAGDPGNAQSNNIGSFALPTVYEKLEAGENTEYFDHLPDWTNGFDGLTKADTAPWTQADWMVWLRNRQDMWAAMTNLLQNSIPLPWISANPS